MAGCALCKQEKTSEFVALTACGHIFHQVCIAAWIRQRRISKTAQTCPVCHALTSEIVRRNSHTGALSYHPYVPVHMGTSTSADHWRSLYEAEHKYAESLETALLEHIKPETAMPRPRAGSEPGTHVRTHSRNLSSGLRKTRRLNTHVASMRSFVGEVEEPIRGPPVVEDVAMAVRVFGHERKDEWDDTEGTMSGASHVAEEIKEFDDSSETSNEVPGDTPETVRETHKEDTDNTSSQVRGPEEATKSTGDEAEDFGICEVYSSPPPDSPLSPVREASPELAAADGAPVLDLTFDSQG